MNVQVVLPQDLLHCIENHGTSKIRMNLRRYLQMLTVNLVTQRGTTPPPAPRPAVSKATISANSRSISPDTPLDSPSMQALATTSTIHSNSLASPTIRANFSAKTSSKQPSSVLLNTNPPTKPGTELSAISSSGYSIAGNSFFYFRLFFFFFIFLLLLFANIVYCRDSLYACWL